MEGRGVNEPLSYECVWGELPRDSGANACGVVLLARFSDRQFSHFLTPLGLRTPPLGRSKETAGQTLPSEAVPVPPLPRPRLLSPSFPPPSMFVAFVAKKKSARRVRYVVQDCLLC